MTPESPLKRPWLWSAFGVLLLAVPVGATLLARAHKTLPRLGHVPAFTLTDQTGRTVRESDFDGKVWVASFVFTSCSEVCPRLTGEVAKLQRYLQNRGQDGATRLLSITVDPERDTPERLAGYAAGFHADPKLWKFATGPVEDVKSAVIRGFKTAIEKAPDEKSADGFTIVHGTYLVLIDGRGEIRGYFDSSDGFQMARLRDQMMALVERGGS